MKTKILSIIVFSICGIFDLQAYTGPFSDPGNGTILDQKSGLVWQKCASGQGTAGDSYTACGTGTATTYTWADALAYCNGLNLNGITGWRLPSVKELVSLADYSRAAAPAIDTTFFPATTGSYWTSTNHPSGSYRNHAYFIAFNAGTYDTVVKTTAYRVRCVR
ncbi:DUF1566 domain-containing protein [Leptospira gomenensis]|uniref:DUF1566 domain-containing protein n=1 Tax=Leptospira gomenensis TaxID=2484974 RepID=A0A5F1YFI4_9LEPT|nr:DUF1566 domain-containing protein [Leptospira gomenensis]TGK37473.1 DUF1566 domain-containing protein [Leptospira gomenensis]TGK40831.1 DUF1566 domain-containing protein [Leptospira gomenensis]TGK43058.1 DUF1566 domain-containing protein [Leptospira gomenensis]TGK54322.1 DUF1566 domain-containing protein [Leptospira gomenensis]